MSFSSRNKALASQQSDEESGAPSSSAPMSSERLQPHTGRADAQGRAASSMPASFVVGPFVSQRLSARLHLTGDPFRDSRSLMLGERQVLSSGPRWGTPKGSSQARTQSAGGAQGTQRDQGVSIEDVVGGSTAATVQSQWGNKRAPADTGSTASKVAGSFGGGRRAPTPEELEYEERYTKSGVAQPLSKSEDVPDQLRTLIRLVSDANNYTMERRAQLMRLAVEKPQETQAKLKALYDRDVAPKMATRVPLTKIAQNHPEAYVFGVFGLEGETPIIVPRTADNAYLRGYHGVSLHTMDAQDSPFPAYTGALHVLGLEAIAAPSVEAVVVPLNAQEVLAADAANARAERLKAELQEAEKVHAAAEEQAKAEELARQASGAAEESALFDLQDAPDDAFGVDLWDGKTPLPVFAEEKSVPSEVLPSPVGGPEGFEDLAGHNPSESAVVSENAKEAGPLLMRAMEAEAATPIAETRPSKEDPDAQLVPVQENNDPWDMSNSVQYGTQDWEHLRELDEMELANEAAHLAFEDSMKGEPLNLQPPTDDSAHAPEWPEHLKDSVPLDAYLVDDEIAQRALASRPRRPGA